MLHVQRGENVNARVEQLQHVLAAFGVPGAGSIGVGQLIHQGQLRTPGQQPIQVHLGQAHAAVLGLEAGNGRQSLGQGVGLLSPVRFDVAHHHVPA